MGEGMGKKSRLVFMLSTANKRLRHWVQSTGDGRAASRHGLLMAVHDDDVGTSFGEIARALDLGTSSLSGLVDRMAASGLIERVADAGDGRASLLRLTTGGREARKVAIDQARQLDKCFREGFSEEELAVVARWLTAVTQRLSWDGGGDMADVAAPTRITGSSR